MPRGVDYKIPLADLLAAAADHEAGISLRAIARSRWRQWGYKSDKSALEGFAVDRRGLDRRLDPVAHRRVDRPERVAQSGNPGHAIYCAHRAHIRQLRNAGVEIPSLRRHRAPNSPAAVPPYLPPRPADPGEAMP